MAIVKVDGVLKNNDNARNEMLKRQKYNRENDYAQKFDIVTPLRALGEDIMDMQFVADADYFANIDYNTRLQLIGHQKQYMNDLQTQFANEKRFLDEKYLTPSLKNFYGDKTAAGVSLMQNTINGRMDGVINLGTGRIADIAEANDARIINDYREVIPDKEITSSDGEEITRYFVEGAEQNYLNSKKYLKNGAGFKYLAEQLNRASKQGRLNRYAEFDKSGNLDINVSYDTKDFQFDEGDSPNFKREAVKRSLINDLGNYASEEDLLAIAQKTWATTETNDSGYKFSQIANKPKSLLSKTNSLFKEHKIATMIGRFHTTLSDNGVDKEPSITDTAISKYGNSHGRNLLSQKGEKGGGDNDTNGYDNPYCRVWTYHHQYNKIDKLIRPFKDGKDPRASNPYQAKYATSSDNMQINGDLDGALYLKQNTVLGENGFVNIAPKKAGCGNEAVEIKRCMFSIENLAWKDVPRKGVTNAEYYISDEQRGPNGGRIMWFPPYDLDFQESVNVNWNQNNFIGRGEPVFTYSNTNRSGTLSFSILVDHPSVIDGIPKNNIKTEISENDVLRFFAGCNTIDTTKGSSCPEDQIEKNNKSQNEEPKELPDLSKCKIVSFYIYFPNNYSGNGVKIPKETWEQNGSSDQAWFAYLLFGKGETFDPVSILYENPGYEIIEDKPLTPREDYDETTGATVYQKTQKWESGLGVVEEVFYKYRTDFDLHQHLKNIDKDNNSREMAYNKDTNYADTQSYGFNLKHEVGDTASTYYNKNLPKNRISTHSFAQIMSIMSTARPDVFKEIPGFNEHVQQIATTGTDADVIEIFKNPERIQLITIKGSATVQDEKNQYLLARRRARSLIDLLKRFSNDDSIVSKINWEVEETSPLKDITAINTVEAKLRRYVYCEILYDAPETSKVSENGTQPQEGEVVFDWGEDGRSYNGGKGTIEASLVVASKSEAKEKPTRYETEADYFKNLKREDPFVFKKLVEKFKYFNPAFHSLSPEGFNARLTFLQQCSRQGHTVEASDTNGFAQTAGNLSFGRMPVCVLRLGDFLNTKMIINGMSISYGANGPMQWDLNPEGIGVQPMYAKVSLQVTILGGQSLEGPINRLQNAVTFNYYANTGVYDNRSDRISLAPEAEVKEVPENIPHLTKEEREDNDFRGSSISYRHIFTPIPNNK